MLDCAAVKAMTFSRLLSNAELTFPGVGYHRMETKKAELKGIRLICDFLALSEEKD
jgi:hypothetical protein